MAFTRLDWRESRRHIWLNQSSSVKYLAAGACKSVSAKKSQSCRNILLREGINLSHLNAEMPAFEAKEKEIIAELISHRVFISVLAA